MKSAPKRLWIFLAILSFAGILKATLPQTVIGSWTAASNLSQARANGTAAMLPDGRILIIGGDDANGPVQSVEIFGTNGAVSSVAAMNVARSRHFAIVLSDGRVLVGGGASGGGITNSAEIYDPSKDSWTPTNPMVEARANATAALLQDGRVVIAGGDNSGTPSSTIEIYDPSTGNFSFAGALSSARTRHAMAVLHDGRVLIIGGSDGANTLASSDIFDPTSGSVSAGPALATARFAHSATTLLDGRVVIVGGSGQASNGPTDLASAEVFDPVTGVFSPAGIALANARQGHQAFLLPDNNSVLIFGGTSGGQLVAASELFTPQISGADGSWTYAFAPTGANVTPRNGSSASAMQQDGLFLAAGGNDTTGNALASTELYAFPTVKTDQSDYAPGTVVTITGSGWKPGETVTLTLVESPLIDTHPVMTAVADGNGNILNTQFSPDIHDVNIRFFLTAIGSQSGFQALNTFTDAVKQYQASITPSSDTAGHAATAYSVKITNDPASTSDISSATINIPAGYTAVITGAITTSPAGLQWTASVSAGVITITANTGPDHISAGQSVTLALTATAPCTVGSYVWTTATSGSFNLVGSQPSVSVTGTCTADHLGVALPASVTAGTPFNFTVTALTASNAVATNYTGTIQFTGSDLQGVFPANYTFTASDAGTHTFSATLKTAGSQSLTATDTVSSITGSSSTTVNAAAASKLAFSVQPTNTNANTNITPDVAVQVQDSSGNPVASGGRSITLAIGTNPASGTLVCGTNPLSTNSSGTATFPNCHINNPGTGYTLTATASGLTAATSNSFNIINPDTTAPVVTLSFSAVDGQNGWYIHSPVLGTVTANDTTTGNSNVTAISCTDGASPLPVGSPTGIGTANASGSLSVSGEGTHNISCQATDSAGNTGAGGASSNTAIVKIDTQAPTGVTGAANRPADHNGWYTSAVTITFTGADSTSGIATCTSTNYSGPDSATASALGHCTDNAGNLSADVAFNFKFDSTPPTAVTLSVTAGTAGTNGWYTSDATVHTSGTETVSTPLNCTADQFQTTETAGQSFNGSCTNDAGLTVNATPLTVKLDKTPPVVNLAVSSGTAGSNGWYTSNVTLHTSGLETISSPVNCDADQLQTSETTGATFNGSCTNDAGLVGHAAPLTVKVDKTPPVVSLAVTNGTAGTNGWYTGDVTVHTSGTETISAPVACDGDQFQTSETTGATFNGSCTNDAGLVGHAVPLTVKLDKTGPSATLAATAGTLGDNGWYISDVTVHAAGTDTISSPVNCTADQFLTTDTAGHTFSGSCTNDAGLTTNAADLLIKRDTTPPVVSITPGRATDHNGWYNHVLAFTNPGTDSTSGIASCTTPAPYSGPDSTTASVSATCTDNAGNVGNGSFSFMFDSTPPTNVTGTPNRTPDHNGWYNHAVDVDFTGNDATSGIELCSTVNYSGPDATVATVNGTCTDKAGNTSAPTASSSFKFDSTPPTAALAVTAGTLGTHGWYTTAVTVSTSGSDTVSNPTNCTADQFQTAETVATIFNGSCTNDAGLMANASPLTVKLDLTPPTAVVLTPSGTLGLNGWYTGDVTIHSSGTETISNPIVCTADQSQTSDTTGQLFHGSCTNDAGLSANATDITIKRDATPPVLVLTFTPDTPDGMNGWWKTPGGVPFGWTCSDATSGVDATYNGGCPSPVSGTITANGSTLFTGQVRDQAGNLSVQVSRSVKLDNVAPVITWNSAADSCSLPGNSGWCRATQTAGFTASDATSGLANPLQASFTQSSGTNSSAVLIASGTVMDAAGNVSASINAGPYKIDSIAPTITITTPANNSNYLLNASVAASYSCSDATSGIASCAGPVANGANISTNPVGAHNFAVNATDIAGNPAIPVTNTYNVQYASGGMCAGDVGHMIRQPINPNGTSVFKQKSTVPAKFAVCDASGASIGTAGVVTSFNLVRIVSGTVDSTVNETVDSTTPDTMFRFDPTGQQWIFNMNTKSLNASTTYYYNITLNDGSAILYSFGLK